MRAEIISVGTELLLGDIVNTNARYLAQQLAQLGFSVYFQTVVGDNAGRLKALVLEAKERSDLLVFTGGLGPTADDLTKETVAEAFGDTLVLDPEELDKIQDFFARMGRPMGDNNVKQAMVPLRGRKLPNENGTAPGAYFRQGTKYAVLLPGPPREMQPMFEEYVRPMLESMQDSAIRSLTLRVFGIGESALEERVSGLLGGSNPTAALYAKTGEVHVRITAKAPTAEQADVMCEEYAGLFRKELGEYIYSDNGDDLETTVVKQLLADGALLATAESCTGGMLSERITKVPGASAVFGYGAVTYANDAKHDMLGVRNATLKRYGAVSSQVAAEMAFGAAAKADADYGVGITGIAGPDGGTVEKPVGLVYIALATGRDVYVKKLLVGGRSRDYVRGMAVINALDMMRRVAQGYEVQGSKKFKKGQEADYARDGKPVRRGGPLLKRVLAVLAVLAALVLLLVAVYYGRAAVPGVSSSMPLPEPTPTAQGLAYGTDEYARAACAYVQQMAEEDPQITGLVALPGGQVEQLVATAPETAQGQLAATEAPAEAEGLALMGGDAVPVRMGTNTLVVGQGTLQPLLALADLENPPELSTFAYYTAQDERVYRVMAVMLLEQAAFSGDGFVPGAQSISTYGEHMDFVLGAKAHSIYDIPVDSRVGDSFMLLAAEDPENEGWYVCVLGRLAYADEETPARQAAAAGSPLMPSGWYAKNGGSRPDEARMYAYWMRWYNTREYSNSEIQMETGLPARDAGPWEYVTIQPLPQRPGASSSSSESSSSEESEEESSEVSSSSSPESSSAPSTQESSSNAANQLYSSVSVQQEEISSEDNSSSEAISSSSESGSSGSSSSSSGSSSSSSEESSSSSEPQEPKPTIIRQRPDTTQLTVTLNGVRVTDTTLNILAQICQREAADQPAEVIKAVAVAAHSWILNQQGTGNEAPSVMGLPPNGAVLDAVREVQGQVLSADGTNPAVGVWHAMAANGTNPAQDLWGISRSYLVRSDSAYEQSDESWRQIITLDGEEVATLCAEKLGIAVPGPDERREWFKDMVKNESGYVQSLKLGGTELSGYSFWAEILTKDGKPLLPSYAFEVDYDGESFVFITQGQGHGCGLSLNGAAGYARQGWDYTRILEHYYPGTKVMAWEA